jgi:hypothetical protein
MARRRRKLSLKTAIGQPVVRSHAARAAWERSGAGAHGKTKKAQRRAERVALRKGDIE